jgi:hypothetical protein
LTPAMCSRSRSTSSVRLTSDSGDAADARADSSRSLPRSLAVEIRWPPTAGSLGQLPASSPQANGIVRRKSGGRAVRATGTKVDAPFAPRPSRLADAGAEAPWRGTRVRRQGPGPRLPHDNGGVADVAVLWRGARRSCAFATVPGARHGSRWAGGGRQPAQADGERSTDHGSGREGCAASSARVPIAVSCAGRGSASRGSTWRGGPSHPRGGRQGDCGEQRRHVDLARPTGARPEISLSRRTSSSTPLICCRTAHRH